MNCGVTLGVQYDSYVSTILSAYTRSSDGLPTSQAITL